MILLTVANKSNTWFVGKFLITKRAIWIIITILKPLKITLNYALRRETGFIKNRNFETQDEVPKLLTLGCFWTMQCSQTLTRCSKQNWFVTLLFGHLQSPIMKGKFWNFFDFEKCQIFVSKFLLFSQLMTCVRLRSRGQIKDNPAKCKIFQAKMCKKV